MDSIRTEIVHLGHDSHAKLQLMGKGVLVRLVGA